MDEAKYSAIKGYLSCREYPPGLDKKQKFVLRRACKSFCLIGDVLHYVDKRPDKSTFNRLVLRGRDEVERAFEECHVSSGGHRGRDTTEEKIRERYY